MHVSEVKRMHLIAVALSWHSLDRPSMDDPVAVLQTGNGQGDAAGALICTALLIAQASFVALMLDASLHLNSA